MRTDERSIGYGHGTWPIIIFGLDAMERPPVLDPQLVWQIAVPERCWPFFEKGDTKSRLSPKRAPEIGTVAKGRLRLLQRSMALLWYWELLHVIVIWIASLECKSWVKWCLNRPNGLCCHPQHISSHQLFISKYFINSGKWWVNKLTVVNESVRP